MLSRFSTIYTERDTRFLFLRIPPISHPERMLTYTAIYERYTAKKSARSIFKCESALRLARQDSPVELTSRLRLVCAAPLDRASWCRWGRTVVVVVSPMVEEEEEATAAEEGRIGRELEEQPSERSRDWGGKGWCAARNADVYFSISRSTRNRHTSLFKMFPSLFLFPLSSLKAERTLIK